MRGLISKLIWHIFFSMILIKTIKTKCYVSNRSSGVALDGDKSPSPLVAKGLRAGVNWRQKKKKTAFPREETLDGDEKKMVRARSNLISRKGGTFRLFGLIPWIVQNERWSVFVADTYEPWSRTVGRKVADSRAISPPPHVTRGGRKTRVNFVSRSLSTDPRRSINAPRDQIMADDHSFDSRRRWWWCARTRRSVFAD